MRHTLRLLAAACAAFALSGAPRSAQAQSSADGFALDRFDPSERGSEWFVLDTLDFRDRVRPAVGVVGDYSYNPLVFYDQNGKESQALVRHQLFLHLGASVALWERLRLAVNLPVAAMVKGSSGDIGTQRYEVAEGGQLGDLRLSADVRLFGRYRGLLTGALGLSVWLPTGSRDAYTGDGKARVAPHVNLAGQASLFVYAAKLGFNLRPQDERLGGLTLGNELFGALSAGVRVADGKLLIGPEIYASTVLKGGAFRARGTPFEGIFGAHYCIADIIRAGGGVGTGFSEGFGSPKFRAVFSVEYAPCAEDKAPAPPPDRDGDGIDDKDDACPDTYGYANSDPAKNGCPLEKKDSDADGILDEVDACPDEAGVASNDPKKHGCPVRDRDSDGIEDEADACPALAGPASSDPSKNGCPDTDGDGIIDPKDACPNAAGPENEDPEKNGCPAARIERGQIRILEQVKFKTNSADILPESDGILNAVLDIMREHAEITRISIEGHTDNVGNPKYNKKLSERRAASVVKWLSSHGVEKKRMSSAGFGMEMPLGDNESEEGRKKNRRVEFHIREMNGQPVVGIDEGAAQ